MMNGMSVEPEKPPFFSVVMPVYGVESFFARAIECVLGQTCSDLELIVVDDGSPDESIRIAESYAASDRRIRIVRHQENKGLSAARNSGIEAARGRYLWIPDPDDWYELDLLERARDIIVKNHSNAPVDAVVFGCTEEYFDEKGARLYSHQLPLPESVIERCGQGLEPRAWRPLVVDLERSTHYGYAWNKMYRMARIREHGFRYEDVLLIEDFLFNAAFFQDAGVVSFAAGEAYHYAKRRGRSLTNANAYGAQEYYVLHRCRVQTLRDQLDSWDVLDRHAKSVLGSLYARYILSTLERQCSQDEPVSRADRRAWCEELFGAPLFQELVPCAQAGSSRALALFLRLLKGRHACWCLMLGRIAHFAKSNAYEWFTRMRSGR